MKKFSQLTPTLLLMIAALTLLNACAAFQERREAQDAEQSETTQAAAAPEATSSDNDSIETKVQKLTTKIDELDAKITMLNDKLAATRTSLDNALGAQKPSATPVSPSASKIRGVLIPPTGSQTTGGFANDEAVQKFRDAMILFEAGKYSEAILEFSAFLREYADHPMAGAAQYHVGESYFRQKEYKLAAEEYNRVLVSYDRSSAVPDTLKHLAEAEEKLNKKDLAAKHRQMLTSMFPQSPAAKDLLAGVPIGKSLPAPAVAEGPSEDTMDDIAPPTAPTAPHMGPETADQEQE